MADKNAGEKVLAVSVEGPADLLDAVIRAGSGLLIFPKDAPVVHRDAPETDEDNPYEKLIETILKTADSAQIPLSKQEILTPTVKAEEIRRFTDDFYRQFRKLQSDLDIVSERIAQSQNLLVHLRHLSSLHIEFSRLFSCKYIKVRFGRLPLDGEKKLPYYDQHLFLYFPFARDAGYVWCAYFTPKEFGDEIDDIFNALFFERVRIPDSVQGTPGEAGELTQKLLREDLAARDLLREQLSRLFEEGRPRLQRMYNEARFLQQSYESHRFTSVLSGRFYLSAFVPRDLYRTLEEKLRPLEGVRAEPAARPVSLGR